MSRLTLTPPPVPDPLEAYHQEQVFYMAELHKRQYPELQYLFAVPNGGFRHKATALAMQRQGVKRGVEDMFLDNARGGYFGLRIELKRLRSNTTSPEQKAWIEHHTQEGYRAVMCRGWEAAWQEILWYLSLPKTQARGDTSFHLAAQRPPMHRT